jgi:SAM-dependent methyltransferase
MVLRSRHGASANVHRDSLDQLRLWFESRRGSTRPDAVLIVVHLWDAARHGQVGSVLQGPVRVQRGDACDLRRVGAEVHDEGGLEGSRSSGRRQIRQHLGHRHLDVGPGTGYFIEKADPPRDTEITLLDPNPTVLRYVAKRLEERHPITVEADVMKPLPVDGPFDSAALSFVLHCLRGPEGNKAVAVRNIADVLSPEGILFGGTVLGLQGNHTRSARAFLRAANKQGAFDNVDDTTEGLGRILEMSFSAVDVDVVGSAALFAAARPRSRS